MKFQRFVLIAAMSMLAVSCRQTPEAPSSEGSVSLPQESTSQPIDSSSSDSIEKYTVTFYCNGKKAKEEEIEKGGHVDMPSDIDYSRYFALKDKGYYVHWYKVVGLDKFTFDFNQETIQSDVSIYGEYIAKTMTMTLDIGNGENNPTMEVTYDQKYEIPDFEDYICGSKAVLDGREIPFSGTWVYSEENGTIKLDALENHGFHFKMTDDETAWLLTQVDNSCEAMALPAVYRDKPVKGFGEDCLANSRVKKLSVPSSYVTRTSEIGNAKFLEDLTVPFGLLVEDYSNNKWAFSSKTLSKLTLVGEGELKLINETDDYYPYENFECVQIYEDHFPKLSSIILDRHITSLGNYSFVGCKSLVSISIPDSLVSIGDGVFGGCSSLASIEIPDSVNSIGNGAFAHCSSLSSVKIPNQVTSIGNCAFRGCSSLASIEIPDSVTSIGYYAFKGCASLTSIDIPDSVTSIASGAFSNCTSLASISIPNSVTSIGKDVFSNCVSLTSVNIPARLFDSDVFGSGLPIRSLNVFGDGAVLESSRSSKFPNLVEATIGEGVASIGDYAFSGCSSLASINIPNSVTSIGDYAFWGCASLASISIPNSVTSIASGAFSRCTSLVSIAIPDSVTSIASGAFSNCTSLASISIPDSVTSIGNDNGNIRITKWGNIRVTNLGNKA